MWWSVLSLPLLLVVARPTRAIDQSIPAIHGDVSRMLLGDGTGVIVGIVDSGIDVLHPALVGNDSLGMPRLVAQANFVTTEPTNTGDDVFGHGTWIASIALGSDLVYNGMAPDARFVNARSLDQSVGFASDAQVRNGIGFAIERGAQVLNLSLNYFATVSGGYSPLDLMVDWAAYERGITTVAAVGNIPVIPDPNSPGGFIVGDPKTARSPGSALNGIGVGRTLRDYSKASITSAGAFTEDGRMKPDVMAPGTLLVMANDDWETGPLWESGFSGTSFAAPHVTGLVAQMLEGGRVHQLSTSPLVLKAAIMNSASKSVLDRDFNPWEQSNVLNIAGVSTVTQPLDTHLGAGQIDGLVLSQQYLSGEMAPGPVAPIGWDYNAIGQAQTIDYVINPPAGVSLTATLTWHRHVGRTDNGNGQIDSFDTFFVTQLLSNLNLQILRDGNPIAQSVSAVDNVEHLRVAIDPLSQYTLRVIGANVFSSQEQFALAWYTTVPEPGTVALAMLCFAMAIATRRFRC